MSIDPSILSKAQSWLNSSLDEEIKVAVRQLLDGDPTELTDAFYRDLEFGTGGLRGIMGAGTNRMNKVTVAMATQGLANYLKKECAAVPQIKVAIAYDSRNNSATFARIAAEVLSANEFRVFLFKELRPTPLLSFAVRHLGCQSGIVITASHNPKEYNGYKVYWDDGGQLVNPHDENVIREVQRIKGFDEVKFEAKPDLIEMIDQEVDRVYLEKVRQLSLSKEIIQHQQDLKIVYTALHGTGITLVPEALKMFGFANVTTVTEQCIPDGHFPTLKSPNPEEPSALEMAIAKASEIGADLVLATDPDADRVGIAVKDDTGKFILFNGNQTASVLIWYLLKMWKEQGKCSGREYIVKTIVTTELLAEMARSQNVECHDVLTGFKYIAEIIRHFEGQKTFIGGGEESYGYLVSDFVRDKDAVISCCMIAEVAAYAKEHGKSFFELYQDICVQHGLYFEDLLSVTKKGKDGAEAIQAMMRSYREQPPKDIAGSEVVMIKDYQLQMCTDLRNHTTQAISLPKSNVLQFFTADGSKVTVRPSGTEPKIKFYFGVRAALERRELFAETLERLRSKVSEIIQSLGLNG